MEIQHLIDGYKISIALYNTVDSYSPADNKEMELYIETLKRLKEASIIISRQVDFLRQTWIQDTKIV